MTRFALREQTLGTLLDDTASRFPHADALIHPARGVRLTWRDFADEVERLARGFMALGIKPGEKIAIWAPNLPQWLTVMFAAAKIGAVLVTVNTGCREADLRYQLIQCRASCLLLADGLPGHDFFATLRNVLTEAPRSLYHLRRIIGLESRRAPGVIAYGEVLELAGETPPEALRESAMGVTPGDVVNMQYTSGTTGLPKGVMLTHRNIGNNGYWIGRTLRLSHRDRVCLPVPLFHCLGCVIGVMACVNHGACMVLTDTFSPSLVLRAVQEEHCTALYGVPSMYQTLLRHPGLPHSDLSSLRKGVMTGSICPESLVREVMERLHMPGLSICYGLTEASPIMTQTRLSDPLRKRTGSVGRALPGIEVAVFDPRTGQRLPPGREGEIRCRGYNVMAGYHAMPQATAEAVDAQGWLHTGDLGTLDANGYLSIVGRIKDMIVRGGENVSPREVEDFLRKRGDIRDVQVVAVPSPRYGEEVGAFLIPREGSVIHPRDVRTYCLGRLARYKVPRYVAVVDSFPMTPNGKVRKGKLREMAARYWS